MKIINHNGKPCVEGNVVMLPTEDNGSLSIRKSTGVIKTYTKQLSKSYQPQHLYITTDEEIKEGDWYLLGNTPRKSTGNLGKPDSKWLKIIATTDPKLVFNNKFEREIQGVKMEASHHKQLPQIPQSFIEEYCKAGGIDEVLVEYEYGFSLKLRAGGQSHAYKLKLNPDNTIIIHPVEEKMYNREEVIELLHKMHRMVFNLSAVGDPCGEFKRDKWIEENL